MTKNFNLTPFEPLHPYFLTGYTDAEGCFSIAIRRRPFSSVGWQVELIFEIGAANNPANRRLLESFKAFFGGGRIQLDKNSLRDISLFRILKLY